MEVYLEEFGRTISLFPTDEWTEERKFLYKSRTCEQSNTALTHMISRDGRSQHVKQCQKCGEQFGSPVKQLTPSKDLPDFDIDLKVSCYDETTKLLLNCDQKHARKQITRGKILSKDHHDYLKSEKWNNKRLKVLKRANFKCEGCMEAKATEVHHLTYDNLKDELLFQLVAICRHGHGKTPNSFDQVSLPETSLSALWDAKCSSCRFTDGGYICGIDGETSINIAQKVGGICSPEPLK